MPDIPLHVLEDLLHLRSGPNPPRLDDALKNTIDKWSEALPGRPYERLRKEYQRHKREQGDQPLDDYLFRLAHRDSTRVKTAKKAAYEEKLKRLEAEAVEALGTQDLSDEALRSRYKSNLKTWRSEEYRSITHGAHADRAEALRQHFGDMSEDEAVEMQADIKDESSRVSRQQDIIEKLLKHREEAPE